MPAHAFALVLAALLVPVSARAQAEIPEADPDIAEAPTPDAEPTTAASATLAEPMPQAATSSDPNLAWLIDTLRVLRPTILGEGDYRVYPREVEGESGFALARLRTGLIFEPASWFRAVGTMEWVGENATLLDAYAVFRPAPWVDINIGYGMPPLFSTFRYEPIHTLAFPDYAPVVTSFFIPRDLGIDLHLAPREVPLEASVRVGNGSGSILGNDTPLPAGYAALDLVLGRAWAGSAPNEREFGLRFGVAGMVESVRDRDGIAGFTPFGFGFRYYRPAIVSGLREVGEVHVIAYAGPVRATVEGAFAEEARSRDDDGNPATPRIALPSIRSSGLTAELAWVFLGRPRVPGRAPGSTDNDREWAGGALEVSARFDALWLGWGAPDVPTGGSVGGALSLRWWPVDFLTVTLAGYTTHYSVPPSDSPNESWSWGGLVRLGFFWGQLPIAAPAAHP